MGSNRIHLIPSFHYDVVYLKGYEEYLAISFANIREALHILDSSPEYTFLIEQVILLEAFWERHPEHREALRRHAAEGRLAVSPGMYVMPDMNHPDGESLFRQVKLGQEWLDRHLGIGSECCWIADCWGHHPQLPQILTQAGYTTYFFWRCMRPEVMTANFLWEGLDGTRLRTHWLARGYGNVRFPSDAEVINAPDLDLRGCGPRRLRELCDELAQYGPGPLLICNGGDFMMPQASAPQAVAALNRSGQLPPIVFSTPNALARDVDWDSVPLVRGEFNSNFQGTFTSNIAIKQRTRIAIGRALGIESLAVVGGRRTESLEQAWKLLLKEQFHDTVCGTVCDEALVETLAELDRAEALLDRAATDLAGNAGPECWYNGLGFPRTELVDHGGGLKRVALDAFDHVPAAAAASLPAPQPATLPLTVETRFYRAEVGADGYIVSLRDATGREFVNPAPCRFGSLALQMDYGDLWLNFEAPLNGGTLESALTRNLPDPYDRSREGDLANRGTFKPAIRGVRAERRGGVIDIIQSGSIGFWKLKVGFETRLRFDPESPRIAWRTTIQPSGRHYRLRAAFPTALRAVRPRHEIPFGFVERGPHEHVAQNWIDLADGAGGIALLNRGIPGNNADDGVLLLSLFRSAAMEYKAPSAASFNEGVAHTFDYAVVLHGPRAEAALAREGQAFLRPPLRLPATPPRVCHGWSLSGPQIVISALRPCQEGIFIRVYEASGMPAAGRLRLPAGIGAWAPADGLERPLAAFAPCRGEMDITLRPFGVKAYVFR